MTTYKRPYLAGTIVTGVCFVLFLLAVPASAQLEIRANGLLKNAAVLQINGRQSLLRVGERSPEGVLLVSADTRQALIEVNGKRQTLTLSTLITGSYVAPATREVTIPRNRNLQYLTNVAVNSQQINALVDTGANVVAMNSGHARRLGLNYKRDGRLGAVKTASGVSPAYTVLLDTVDVGGITVRRVEATIIEGDFPEMVLLGMSYLQHVKLREDSGVMYLQEKY